MYKCDLQILGVIKNFACFCLILPIYKILFHYIFSFSLTFNVDKNSIKMHCPHKILIKEKYLGKNL